MIKIVKVLMFSVLFGLSHCGTKEESLKSDSQNNPQEVVETRLQALESITLSPEQSPLTFDLQTGRVSQLGTSQALCLKTEILNHFRDLLSQASVCKTTHDIPEDTLCTLIYKLPYVTLNLTEDELTLGRQTSGCPKETVDLCEDAQSFRDLVESVDEQNDFENCN